jgi:DNA polymerase-3 subunit delta'
VSPGEHVWRPIAHDVLVERLWRAAGASRLPHALLFEGPEGIGKFLAARWLAAGLLCASGPGQPCGSCGPCKRVESGNHPDLMTIDPVAEEEERIKIARIARRSDADEDSLEAFLDLRAMEGERRCVLIREVHRMNDAAQNALLKTLEEPRPGTLLVLETHRPGRLLVTILSRCIRLRFDPLEREACARVLDERGLEPDLARRLARWADGSPGRALAWSERNAPAVRSLLEAGLHGTRPPLLLAAELWELEGAFQGARPTAKARDRARFVLDLGLEVVRDTRRLEAGLPAEELAHGELAATLLTAPEATGVRTALRRAFERLLGCRDDVDRNLGPEPILERALLELADLGRILQGRSGRALTPGRAGR